MGEQVPDPRRKTVSSGDVQTFSTILTDITEALKDDKPEKALTIASTHVDWLLKRNAPVLAQTLLNDIPELREDMAMQQGYSFLLDFLEAVVNETAAMVDRNQKILRKVLEAAKESELFLDEMIKENRDDMCSADFLVYLDAEIESVGATSAAGKLLETVRLRLLEEAGSTMSPDVAVLPRLLAIEDELELKEKTLEYLQGFNDIAIELFLQNIRFMKKQMDRKYNDVDPALIQNLTRIEMIAAGVVASGGNGNNSGSSSGSSSGGKGFQ